MQWSIRKAAALGQALRTAHQIRAVTDPPRLFAAAPRAVFGVKQIEDLVCQILEVRSVYRKVTLPLSLAAVRIRITRSLTGDFVNQFTQETVLGRHTFLIGLIIALDLDHVDHFPDNIDIRSLKVAL